MATAPQIRIFRVGTFQDIHGTTHDFSSADLDEIVESYDAERDPAPLVIGHPQHDNPAYGWAGRLYRDGDTLIAEPSDLVPEFAEAVRAKRFRKVSASFYPRTHPGNPKPGKWGLKHIGFLGAAAPAVKGLGTVAFSEADEGAAFTLPFTEEPPMELTPEQREAAFAEREQAIAERERTAAEKEGQLVEREATMIAAEQLATRAEHASFAEAQVAAGRLAPAGKDRVTGLLEVLASAATVSFGEADGEMRPVDAFRSLLEGAAPVVSFAEVAPPESAITGEPSESPDQLAARAVSFMESEKSAGREITIQAAVRHVHTNPPAA